MKGIRKLGRIYIYINKYFIYLFIYYYLCAVPTAAKPITDTAQCIYIYIYINLKVAGSRPDEVNDFYQVT
jgi:hypothetical protein